MLRQLIDIPILDPARAEFFAEAMEDNDRAGYINLGNADNGPIWYAATSDAYINLQGGNDTFVVIGNTNGFAETIDTVSREFRDRD